MAGGPARRRNTMPPFTHAVAAGMQAYASVAFRLEPVGAAEVEIPPATVILSTHRRDTDVPLVCAALWRRTALWRRAAAPPTFAARSDLHMRGFLAGFPPRLPLLARKALFGLELGPALVRAVRVLPIRSGERIELVDALRWTPGATIADLPEEVAAALVVRAEQLGLPRPERAADVLRGEYADLVWRRADRDDLSSPAFEEAWRRWRSAALADFRRLVEVVAAGGVLLFFPEGSPSKDGRIGPFLPGIDALLRRAKPKAILPVAPAYDPLVAGRTRALVALGRAEPPGGRDLLGLLRRTTPLTVGQVVADRLLAGGEPAPDDLVRAAAEADAAGRPRDPELLEPRRLDEAVAAARRADPALLAFLAREYRTAREAT